MARKILQCTIKTIDEKNHVRIWNESEVEITFKGDKEKPKEIITSSSLKTKIKKKITKKN